MNDERCSDDLPISIQDFKTSGWKEAIAHAQDYFQMNQAFNAAAYLAIKQGRNRHGKVLELLAKACAESDKLKETSPFELSDAEITFFAEIVDAVDNDWLKALINDLLWFKKHDYKFAQEAINAYLRLPFTKGYWSRALFLAKNIKKQDKLSLQKIETAIIGKFNMYDEFKDSTGKPVILLCEKFERLELAKFLRSKKLGKKYQELIAKKLKELAHELDAYAVQEARNSYVFALEQAQQVFLEAAKWYKDIDQYKETEMKEAAGDVCVKKAKLASDFMAKNSCNEAIQIYHSIPQKQRTDQITEKIDTARHLSLHSGQQIWNKMERFSIDINCEQAAALARERVAGKSVEDALFHFVNLFSEINPESLRNASKEDSMKEDSTSEIVSNIQVSDDGRQISKLSPEKRETSGFYKLKLFPRVQNGIIPMLEILQREHQLQEDYFVKLAKKSPIVPKERVAFFGKALYFGYTGDFFVALHLLVPQIEHLIRKKLKDKGVLTVHIDKNGNEDEKGMNTLLELPEAKQVFGENLVFELNSLFCDKEGFNLRNKLAHGLLDENESELDSIYAWWLTLRLILVNGEILKQQQESD